MLVSFCRLCSTGPGVGVGEGLHLHLDPLSRDLDRPQPEAIEGDPDQAILQRARRQRAFDVDLRHPGRKRNQPRLLGPQQVA